MAEKTIVPGMDFRNNDGTDSEEFNFPQHHSSSHNCQPFKTKSREGTLISGMDDSEVPQRGRGSKSIIVKSKPIAGFLFSVSNTLYGEYWPLYLGQNKIGRDETSDIVLNESTVSADHASITVQRDDETGELFAVIEDTHSTNGVKLNGKSIHFYRVACKHMDIITIGKNYQLLLLLPNIAELGLHPSADFKELERRSVRSNISHTEGRISSDEPISGNDGGRTRPIDGGFSQRGGTLTK